MAVAEVCPIALPPQCLPLQYLEPAPNTSGSLHSPGLPFNDFLRYRCPLPCHFLLWGKVLRLAGLLSPLFLTASSLLSFPTCCFPPLNHFPLPRHFPASPLSLPHIFLPVNGSQTDSRDTRSLANSIIIRPSLDAPPSPGHFPYLYSGPCCWRFGRRQWQEHWRCPSTLLSRNYLQQM